MWAQVVLVVTGVWLMCASAVLGYGGAAATSDRIAGPALAAIAFLAAFAITRGLRWCNLVAGVWLVAAPWLLNFPVDASVSSLVCGVGALVLAPIGSPEPERFGGGWIALRRTDRLPPPASG